MLIKVQIGSSTATNELVPMEFRDSVNMPDFREQIECYDFFR